MERVPFVTYFYMLTNLSLAHTLLLCDSLSLSLSLIVAFCLLCQYYATVPTSGFAIEVTLRLRSKLCPNAALQQVQVVGLSSQR